MRRNGISIWRPPSGILSRFSKCSDQPQPSEVNLMASVLITGTSTGIGLATALTLGRAGHKVYATMRNPSRAPELGERAAQEGLPVKVSVMDVDSDGSVKTAIADIQ